MNVKLFSITIDSIVRLFADYAGEVGVPTTSKALRLLLHPAERKLRIETTFDGEDPLQHDKVIRLDFDIKRVYSVS